MLFSVGDTRIYLGWQFDPVLLGTLLALIVGYALATGEGLPADDDGVYWLPEGD